MINFLKILNNIKLGNYLHGNGSIDDNVSKDIIGVCVIPSGFLPDGYARFISLKERSYCPFGINIDLKLESEYKTELPGTRKDETFIWGNVNKDGDRPLITPYLSDCFFNPEFLRDLPNGNAFQDYKGYENMKIYKEKYGDNKLYYNAFTEVIEKSPSYRKDDWYLPAIGELAFIPPRFEIIKNKAREAFKASSKGIIIPACNFWSSSEWDSYNAWYMVTSYGYVAGCSKVTENCIRAFLAL